MAGSEGSEQTKEETLWASATQLLDALWASAAKNDKSSNFQVAVQSLSGLLRQLEDINNRDVEALRHWSGTHLQRRHDEAEHELKLAEKQFAAAMDETATLKLALEHGGEALDGALRSQDMLRGLRWVPQCTPCVLDEQMSNADAATQVWESNAGSVLSSIQPSVADPDQASHASDAAVLVKPPSRPQSPPAPARMCRQLAGHHSCKSTASARSPNRVVAQRSLSSPQTQCRDVKPQGVLIERHRRVPSPSSKSASPPREEAARVEGTLSEGFAVAKAPQKLGWPENPPVPLAAWAASPRRLHWVSPGSSPVQASRVLSPCKAAVVVPRQAAFSPGRGVQNFHQSTAVPAWAAPLPSDANRAAAAGAPIRALSPAPHVVCNRCANRLTFSAQP